MPLREEPWGERAFQVTDPNGGVVQLLDWNARQASDSAAGAADHLPSRPQGRTHACAKSAPLHHPAAHGGTL